MIVPMPWCSYSGIILMLNTINVDVTIAELGKHRRSRKLLDANRLTALGWQARIALKEGVASTFQWLEHELAQGQRLRGFSAGEACRLAGHAPRQRAWMRGDQGRRRLREGPLRGDRAFAIAWPGEKSALSSDL